MEVLLRQPSLSLYPARYRSRFCNIQPSASRTSIARPNSSDEESVSELGHELNEATSLNAKDAEAFAKVRKGKLFSAFLCE